MVPMTTSVTYHFELPEQVDLSLGEGRALIAALLDDLPGVASLFHYDARGKPIAGLDAQALNALPAESHTRANNEAAMPQVRFLSRRNYLQITALTPQAQDEVDRLIPDLVRALMARFKGFPAMRRMQEHCAIEPSEQFFRYRVHHMIVERDIAPINRFLKLDTATQAERIAEKIVRSLYRQGSVQGADLGLDVPDLLGLQVPRLAPLVIARHPDGRPAATALCAGAVTFSMPFKISGHWAVGGLTARGYGRLWYDTARGAGRRKEAA